MAEGLEGNYDPGSQSDESYHVEKSHIEPLYDAFICPLTKQVMRDPVTAENGYTFEREAIEKWFKECKESGRKLICPLTLKDLRSMDLNPSLALRNTIEEWTARNEVAQLDIASRSLSFGSSENDVLHALKYILYICQKNRSNKHAIRNAELIPLIVNMLKSGSRRVRCKALETLRIVAEEDTENKEAIVEGDTIRTIVKFLSDELSQERHEAVSLLYELSKSEFLHEKIGAVNGVILMLVGMTSSKSENILTLEKADKTLENLEKCEKNVRQMAENGRLQKLLALLLEGSPETKLAMATHLGELVLSNDVKVYVARSVGPALIDMMRSGNMLAREASVKALNQISSFEASAKILIEAGILPPLVKDIFTVGVNQLPMKLKEVSATVLANIVSSGSDFESIPVGPAHQTLLSEDIIHNLLHLISNTGPTIATRLLQVLVGLAGSPSTIASVVSAINSSGATISLIQFIEAPQRDLRMASVKLLQHISLHMGQELADALQATAGQLGSLIRLISDNNGGIAEDLSKRNGGITEEQAAAVGFLADLPERDVSLTQRLLEEHAFEVVINRVNGIRLGETRGNRFFTPYLEGLVHVLARLTFVLPDEPDAVAVARNHNIAALFADLLQSNGLNKVQMVSAIALKNLSQESKRLTNLPETPDPSMCGGIFRCFQGQPAVAGLCRVHHGICSLKESFCLLEGKTVGRLVACLDHVNEHVVEAALAALCTLLDDRVDMEQGVQVLCEAEAVKPILDILLENKTEVLRRRAVWAVERMLRSEDIAFEVSGDQNVGTALVEAFRHGDYRTRQIAERALKHIDKIPNFSGVFHKK